MKHSKLRTSNQVNLHPSWYSVESFRLRTEESNELRTKGLDTSEGTEKLCGTTDGDSHPALHDGTYILAKFCYLQGVQHANVSEDAPYKRGE